MVPLNESYPAISEEQIMLIYEPGAGHEANKI